MIVEYSGKLSIEAATALAQVNYNYKTQEEIITLKQRIAELEAAGKWISVEDSLPETKCIALYKNSLGKPRMVMAEYIKKHTLEASPDCDGEGVSEYCEEKDIYYYTEGWWEIVENWDEYKFIVIHEGEVTHWQHLPECPTQVFGGE